MPKVRMLYTYAGPDSVLHAGKVYNLDEKRAAEFLKTGSGAIDDSAAAEIAPRSAKATKIPDLPDPGDTVDEDDELEDDEADDDKG